MEYDYNGTTKMLYFNENTNCDEINIYEYTIKLLKSLFYNNLKSVLYSIYNFKKFRCFEKKDTIEEKANSIFNDYFYYDNKNHSIKINKLLGKHLKTIVTKYHASTKDIDIKIVLFDFKLKEQVLNTVATDLYDNFDLIFLKQSRNKNLTAKLYQNKVNMFRNKYNEILNNNLLSNTNIVLQVSDTKTYVTFNLTLQDNQNFSENTLITENVNFLTESINQLELERATIATTVQTNNYDNLYITLGSLSIVGVFIGFIYFFYKRTRGRVNNFV